MSETCRVIINQVKQKLHLVGYLLIRYSIAYYTPRLYGIAYCSIMAPVLGTINFGNMTFVSHCDECQAYSFPSCDAVYFGRHTFLETNYTASRPRRSQSYHNHNHKHRITIVPLNAIRTSNFTKLF